MHVMLDDIWAILSVRNEMRPLAREIAVAVVWEFLTSCTTCSERPRLARAICTIVLERWRDHSGKVRQNFLYVLRLCPLFGMFPSKGPNDNKHAAAILAWVLLLVVLCPLKYVHTTGKD